MKLSLCILVVMLTCLFAVFVVGCGFLDPDPVHIVSVDPPEGRRLEPGLHAIVVTFDGEPEGLKADGGPPSYEEIPFEFSGNTATFHQRVELGGSIGIHLTWENIDRHYDSPYKTTGSQSEERYISFPCRSDAVVTFPDNSGDVRVVPPWPNFANFVSGSPNVDSLRLEVPIYIDKVLEYDLPIVFDRYKLFLTKYPDAISPRNYPEEGRLSSHCVIEKGSTGSVCTIEIPTGIEGNHKDYEFNSLYLYLQPQRVPYSIDKELLVIIW